VFLFNIEGNGKEELNSSRPMQTATPSGMNPCIILNKHCLVTYLVLFCLQLS